MKRFLLLLIPAIALTSCGTTGTVLGPDGLPLKKEPVRWSMPGVSFSLSWQGISAGITLPGRGNITPQPALPVDSLPGDGKSPILFP